MRCGMRTGVAVLPVVVAVTLLNGCSAATRYRVLSFFFDGVPKPGGPDQAGGAGGRATASSRASSRTVVRFTHGPYGAKLCDACHAQRTLGGFVAPWSELCVRCHELRTDQKVLHGPFAAAECLECHNPHASPRRYMLVAEVGEMCQKCHSRASLTSVGAHDPFDDRCTDCHHPHASDRDRLLR